MASYYSRPGSTYSSTSDESEAIANMRVDPKTYSYDKQQVAARTAEGAGQGALTGAGMALSAAAPALLGGASLLGPVGLAVAGTALAGAAIGGAISKGKERKAQVRQAEYDAQTKELQKQQEAAARDAEYDMEQAQAAQSAQAQLSARRGGGAAMPEQDAVLADNLYGVQGNSYNSWRQKVYG